MEASTRSRAQTFPTWCCILLFLIADMLGLARADIQTPISKEYQVKAAFLYNFASFVEWPNEVFPDLNAPLVIGVLGEDPYGSFLDQIVSGEKVNGHPLLVQRYKTGDEIKSCHILFINAQNRRLDRIIADLKGKSILTVGESDDFAQRGGTIQFFTDRGKIRFKINVNAAEAANLRISSKLLRSAEVPPSGKN